MGDGMCQLVVVVLLSFFVFSYFRFFCVFVFTDEVTNTQVDCA